MYAAWQLMRAQRRTVRHHHARRVDGLIRGVGHDRPGWYGAVPGVGAGLIGKMVLLDEYADMIRAGGGSM